eukprot:Gb_16153 [translate_table: standard]
MEPSQKYSRRAHVKRGEDRNPARTPESNAKAIEETDLLAETKNCQPEATPSRASLDLTCESHTLSNITHKPTKDSTTQRDSSGIPQASTEGSPPKGTNQSNNSQSLEPTGQAYKDPLVFDISTTTIQKLTSKLIESDPKKPNPHNESPIIFPTNSRSFERDIGIRYQGPSKNHLVRKGRPTTPLCNRGRDFHR